MSRRRICQGCFTDWINETQELCFVCTYDHVRVLKEEQIRYTARNVQPTEWWGAHWSGDRLRQEENEINGSDLALGFHAEDANGKPIESFFTAEDND